MYRLSDERSAIREIQRFLYVISDRVNQDIPRISIDGIYGSETREAVEIFQASYGIPISGTVDLNTFDTLYRLYSEETLKERLNDYVITDDGFPIKVGTQSNDVVAIHLLISELSKNYLGVDSVGNGSYFSENSKKATTALQNIFRMPMTGEVDAYLFERMKTEIDSLMLASEIYD